MAWNLFRPNSISPSRLYAFALAGVTMGVLVGLLAIRIEPSEFPYIWLGLTLVGLASTSLVAWLLRLWLVGRVDRNIEGRISPSVLRPAGSLAIASVGMSVAMFLLIAYLL